MAGLVGETDHLVFDGRAVPGTAAEGAAAVDRRFPEPLGDDPVGLFSGPGHAASHLVLGDRRGHERKGRGRLVAGLHLQALPGDGPTVEARRRAGLEAAHRQTEGVEPIGQADRRRLSNPARGDAQIAAMDHALQEGAGGQDHPAGGVRRPGGAADPRHLAVFDQKVFGRVGDDGQIGLLSQGGLHGLAVEPPVDLGARAADRRPLGPVQQPELDAGHIR